MSTLSNRFFGRPKELYKTYSELGDAKEFSSGVEWIQLPSICNLNNWRETVCLIAHSQSMWYNCDVANGHNCHSPNNDQNVISSIATLSLSEGYLVTWWLSNLHVKSLRIYYDVFFRYLHFVTYQLHIDITVTHFSRYTAVT